MKRDYVTLVEHAHTQGGRREVLPPGSIISLSEQTGEQLVAAGRLRRADGAVAEVRVPAVPERHVLRQPDRRFAAQLHPFSGGCCGRRT